MQAKKRVRERARGAERKEWIRDTISKARNSSLLGHYSTEITIVHQTETHIFEPTLSSSCRHDDSLFPPFSGHGRGST